MSDKVFRDAADSVRASYTPDMGAINQSDPAEIQISKAQDSLREAIDRLELGTIEQASEILMETIGKIDAPVIYAHQAARALIYVIDSIVGSHRRSMEAECMAASVGIMFHGNTLDEIASRHGVTRAAVSKRVKEIQDELSIACSSINKRSLSRNKYRAGNAPRIKLPVDFKKAA